MKTNSSARLVVAALAAMWFSSCMCATTSVAIEIPKPLPVDGKINWVYDYAEGKQLSKDTGKPMFVVFRCER